MKKSNYDKFPAIKVNGHTGIAGWKNIIDCLQSDTDKSGREKTVLVIESYHGVYLNEVTAHFGKECPDAILIDASAALKSVKDVDQMVYPFVTDDPVFGYMAPLGLIDFFDVGKIAALQKKANQVQKGLVVVYGTGASLITPAPHLLVYADMPRWEIQLRFRKNTISNLGAYNTQAEFSYQYKRGFFVDWRVCDRHKKSLLQTFDYLLDTTIPEHPKMISGATFRSALSEVVSRPFRVVPFFDPGPWGGQWLKEFVILTGASPILPGVLIVCRKKTVCFWSLGKWCLKRPQSILFLRNPKSCWAGRFTSRSVMNFQSGLISWIQWKEAI
ncbi:MAG: hypothetical protein WKI04_00315 [Ferruginibacter sp.]